MKLRIKENTVDDYYNSFNTVNKNILFELHRIKREIPNLEFDIVELGENAYVEAKAINTETMESTIYDIDLYRDQLCVACQSVNSVKKFNDLDSFREWMKEDIEDVLF